MEKKRPGVGVAVVVLHQGKVLLGKRKGSYGGGLFAFPGGHLEFGEEVEACAQRELEEETGLRVLSYELGTWCNDRIQEDKHYITLFVYVHAFEGILETKEPDKCEGWDWYDWDNIPTPLFPTIYSFIQKVGLDVLKGFSPCVR